MASEQRSSRVLLLVAALVWPFCFLWAQAPAPQLDDPAIDQRISLLLAQMTLEEKVGQIVHFDNFIGPGATHADYREAIVQGQVGSFENITGAVETNALQKLA